MTEYPSPIINIFPKMNLLMLIHFHIEHKSTGTPREFAHRLKLSERSMYRVLEELRDIGINIQYSRVRCSYIYTDENKINNLFKINHPKNMMQTN